MSVKDEKEAMAAAKALVKQGTETVVHKSGGKGAYLMTQNEAELIQGFKVSVVDTTAAGDSFNAGLAVSIAKGNDLKTT